MNQINIAVVSFGTGPEWSGAKFRLKRQMKKLFPTTNLWISGEEDLKEIGFLDDHNQFIRENPHGFGLWIWKPRVILEAMERFPDSQVIFYLDAGCELNFNRVSERRFGEYCDIALSQGGLGFELAMLEKDWTSPVALKNMNATKSKNYQVIGTVLFIRNDKTGKKFIEKWQSELSKYSYSSLKGSENLKPDVVNSNHRHDQSILSILWHRSNYATLPDETYFPKKNKKALKYPIWASRNRLPVLSTSPWIIILAGRVFRKIYLLLYRSQKIWIKHSIKSRSLF